jgi:hypothetical protein
MFPQTLRTNGYIIQHFFCVSSMSAIAETMGPKICLPEHEKNTFFDE